MVLFNKLFSLLLFVDKIGIQLIPYLRSVNFEH
jgi:hypothetical protein